MTDMIERVTRSWSKSMATIDGQIAAGEIDLDLPMLKWEHLLLGNLFYFVTVYGLTMYMKNKPAFELKSFMRCVGVGGGVCGGGESRTRFLRDIAGIEF